MLFSPSQDLKSKFETCLLRVLSCFSRKESHSTISLFSSSFCPFRRYNFRERHVSSSLWLEFCLLLLVFGRERPGVFYCFRDKKRMKDFRFRCSSSWTTTRFLTMKFLSRSLRTSWKTQRTCRSFFGMRFPSDFFVDAPLLRNHSCVK